MLWASVLVVLVTVVTHPHVVRAICILTSSLFNCALITLHIDVLLYYIQPNFFFTCFHIVVVSVHISTLNGDVIFAQIPYFVGIVVFSILSDQTVFTLGPKWKRSSCGTV